MYNLTITTHSGVVYNLGATDLEKARELIEGMWDDVKQATISTNEPLLRLKG